jgi:hypothetical protein
VARVTALQLSIRIRRRRSTRDLAVAQRAFLAWLLIVLAVGCAAVSMGGSGPAALPIQGSLAGTSSPSESGVKGRAKVGQRVAILVALDPARRKPRGLRDRSVPEHFALEAAKGDRAGASQASLLERHPQNKRQVSVRPRPFHSQAPPRLSS